jgi:hypothetical protein
MPKADIMGLCLDIYGYPASVALVSTAILAVCVLKLYDVKVLR